MPLLLTLLHGNQSGMPKMMTEFQSYWMEYTKTNQMTDIRSTISKRQLEKKIQSIASKAHNATLGKICYSVNPDVLTQYGMVGLELGSGLVYPVPKVEMNGRAAPEEVESCDSLKTVENGNVDFNGGTKTNGDLDSLENDKSIMETANSKLFSLEPVETMVID